MNEETLKTLSDSLVRNDRLAVALESKLKELDKEMDEFIEGQAKKKAWVQQRLTELNAEQSTLRKSEKTHSLIEKFVETTMKGFKEAQESDVGKELGWMPDMVFNAESVDKINKPSIFERVFTFSLEMINSAKTVEDELKEGLLEVNKKSPIMIPDDPEARPQGSKRKAESEELAEKMPPPKVVPRSKKAPFPPPDKRKKVKEGGGEENAGKAGGDGVAREERTIED